MTPADRNDIPSVDDRLVDSAWRSLADADVSAALVPPHTIYARARRRVLRRRLGAGAGAVALFAGGMAFGAQFLGSGMAGIATVPAAAGPLPGQARMPTPAQEERSAESRAPAAPRRTSSSPPAPAAPTLMRAVVPTSAASSAVTPTPTVAPPQPLAVATPDPSWGSEDGLYCGALEIGADRDGVAMVAYRYIAPDGAAVALPDDVSLAFATDDSVGVWMAIEPSTSAANLNAEGDITAALEQLAPHVDESAFELTVRDGEVVRIDAVEGSADRSSCPPGP